MIRRGGAVIGLLMLVACASSGTSPSGPARTAAVSPAPSASVIGRLVPAPVARPTVPAGLSRGSAIGHTVYITGRAFVPRILIAGVDAPVVFWNTTGSSQMVEFVNYGAPVASQRIPPGAGWAFKPSHTASVAYESGDAPPRRGFLEIQLVQPVKT